MDLIMLLIIAVVIKSVFDSQKAKDNSKNRQGQHPSGPGKPESGKPKPQRAKQETQPTGLEDIFGQMMGKMKESLTLETEQAKPQKASSGQTKKKKTAESSKGKKNQQKPKQQAQRSASSHQSREERTEHERLRPSVKPIKSVFEEQDNCGHRVELNPNINYSQGQVPLKPKRSAIQVNHDQDTILQSIIWAEILSKPKALENGKRYLRR